MGQGGSHEDDQVEGSSEAPEKSDEEPSEVDETVGNMLQERPRAPAATGPHEQYLAFMRGETLYEETADSSWFDEMISRLESGQGISYPMQGANWGLRR